MMQGVNGGKAHVNPPLIKRKIYLPTAFFPIENGSRLVLNIFSLCRINVDIEAMNLKVILSVDNPIELDV